MGLEAFSEFIGLVATGLAISALVLGGWRRERWSWTFTFAVVLIAIAAVRYGSNAIEWTGTQLAYVDPVEDYLDVLSAVAWLLLLQGCLRDLVEARRREQDECRRDVLRRAPIGIVELTPDGTVLDANPAAGELFGRPPEALAGGRMVDWADTAADRRILQQRLLASPSVTEAAEIGIRRQDGTSRRVHLELTAHDAAAGRTCYLVDTTTRCRQENELRQANADLAAALETLGEAQKRQLRQERLGAFGQMASGVAHDFNNLLTPILGYADLVLLRLERGDDLATIRRHVEAIKTAAADAGRVVNRLRSFYRPADPGALTEIADANDLLEDAVNMTRPLWQSQAQGGGATFHVVREFHARQPLVGDLAELRGIVANLICNAVDAMPDGGTITCSSRDDGGHLSLAIQDDGPGMDEATLAHCLDPFFTTKGDHGSGLGLSMVFGAMKRHGGAVRIVSSPGLGTTVTLVFPVRASPAPAAPAPVEPLPDLDLLLVDDDEVPREAVAALLRACGHRVTAVADPRTVLDILAGQSFDVLMTDRAMPNLNGDRLAVAVKERFPNLPIILLTGFGGLMADDDGPPAGVDLVVGKPVDRAALITALARVRVTAADSGE